ncbi:PPOX class F420-dependent oxidoreductase [Lapillicoccus jejuensis]|uniref:PPOX class probable F420-dependent enzyme n=1 Tax=Lapillicoccus jejuensis TaxID=402171 RepID=A0A542E223_9MICO|nr:PPOX class F420-dependent oxidoreductase [Lapillicoccus jejuensis]TQJ09393.1 PPOX class probable F420-dependent enzyme [Lapillicoccus jejuensis]
MDLDTARELAREQRRSVLVTLKRDGRPQLSNVLHLVGDDGRLRVSITADRAKYHNLRRTPWGALHVTTADFWSYAVLEADVELLPVAQDPHDATVDALVEYYRTAQGEHPDWDEYRAAMVVEQRLLAVLTPTHAYGQRQG